MVCFWSEEVISHRLLSTKPSNENNRDVSKFVQRRTDEIQLLLIFATLRKPKPDCPWWGLNCNSRCNSVKSILTYFIAKNIPGCLCDYSAPTVTGAQCAHVGWGVPRAHRDTQGWRLSLIINWWTVLYWWFPVYQGKTRTETLWYRNRQVLSQEDQPLLVWQLLLLKSEHWSFVLSRRNTDEHYGTHNLLQNSTGREFCTHVGVYKTKTEDPKRRPM